jgi:hypothetical protein
LKNASADEDRQISPFPAISGSGGRVIPVNCHSKSELQENACWHRTKERQQNSEARG